MNRLIRLWGNLRSSFWFVPSLVVGGSIIVALALIETDSVWGDHLRAQWPRLFGVGAEAGQSHQKSHTTQDLSKVCLGVVFILVTLPHGQPCEVVVG